jgi:hypothetical protein
MTEAVYSPLLSSYSDIVALVVTVALLFTLAIIGTLYSAYFSYERYRSKYILLLCCLVREEENNVDAGADIEMQSARTDLITGRLLEVPSTTVKVKSLYSVDNTNQSDTKNANRTFTI